MQGYNEQIGIAPRLYEAIFTRIEQEKSDTFVKVSMFEIYNERIIDLLDEHEKWMDQKPLKIKMTKERGFFIEDLSAKTVKSLKEIQTTVNAGYQLQLV